MMKNPCFRSRLIATATPSFVSSPRYSQHTDQSVSRHEPTPASISLPVSQSQASQGDQKTYHTTRRPKRLRLTPKLIPIPLDIIHPIENDKAVATQRPLRTCIRQPPRLLLRTRRIVHRPRIVDIVVRGNDVYLVPGFRRGDCACFKESGLGFFQARGELVRAVGEARAGVAG
jgi:hypothetical protein